MNTNLIKRNSEPRRPDTKLNAINLNGCSTPEQVASVGLTAIREIFPVKDFQESDLAVRLRVEMLTDIVVEVGTENFLAAVKKAITLSHNRFDCSIRKIRECADLRYTPEPAPAYRAWRLVTEIVQKHVRRSPEGAYRLEPYYAGGMDKPVVTPVPEIPAAIKGPVQALGGWGALACCPAEFWAQRMKDFVQLYEE